MKVLLIQPPVRDFYHTAIRTQPLGLAYLAAALEQQHSVEIMDCHCCGHTGKLPVPKSFAHMKSFYADGDLSPFRLYTHFYHFGLSYDEIRERIAHSRPQAVGIACQFTPYVQEALEVARLVKSLLPEVPVIMGGAHASGLPEHVLGSPDVDYAVIGEGEETLPRLISSIEHNRVPRDINGIGFKENGCTRINPPAGYIEDLDGLPFPARHLMDTSRYIIKGEPYTMLLTSRGCPQRCSYCSVGAIMGNRLRVRSIENVLREIRYCRDTLGISTFDIEDDNFTHDTRRATGLLTGIIDEFGENAVKLFAMNGLSLISLNGALLRRMRKAGFQHVDLALGSISRKANRKIGRPSDPARTESVLQQAHALGLPATTYIIIGLPHHSLQDMVASILYLAKRPTLLGPSMYYPSPGSRDFAALYRDRLPTGADHALLRSSLVPVETPDCTRIDLVTLLRLARWINFIKRLLWCCGIESISVQELEEPLSVRWWPGGVPASSPDAPGGLLYLSVPEPLTPDQSGKILTAIFMRRHAFFGMRRIPGPFKELYLYQLFPCKTSAKVVRLFRDMDGPPHIRAAVIQSNDRQKTMEASAFRCM